MSGGVAAVADAVDAAVGVVITTAYLDEGDAQASTLPFTVARDRSSVGSVRFERHALHLSLR